MTGTIGVNTPNFYGQVNQKLAGQYAELKELTKKQEPSFKGQVTVVKQEDDFVASKVSTNSTVVSSNAPEKKDEGWGPVKTAFILITSIAAFKTGKGLKSQLKGKNIKKIAGTIFNKKTLESFVENMKAWKWFPSLNKMTKTQALKKLGLKEDAGNREISSKMKKLAVQLKKKLKTATSPENQKIIAEQNKKVLETLKEALVSKKA